MSIDEIKFTEGPENTPDPQQDESDIFSVFDVPTRLDEKPTKKRLNPRTRTLILALVGVVILALALVLLTLFPGGNTSDASSSSGSADNEAVIPLITKTAEAKDGVNVIKKIVVKNTADQYTVVYDSKDECYYLDGYKDLDLDVSDVGTLADCVGTFNAQEKLLSVTKLSDYGLEKSSITVTTTYFDDSSITLLVGNKTPAGSGYYVCIKGSKEVYIASESMISPFQKTAGQYVQRVLLTAPSVKEDDANGVATMKDITFTGTAFESPLSLRLSTTDDGEEYSYFKYVITKPYFRAADTTVCSNLSAFTNLEAIEAVALHPTQKQLEKYGLKNPAVIADFTLTVESSKQTDEDSQEEAPAIYYNSSKSKISIGNKDADGNYYILIDGTNAVFTVAADKIAVLAERRYENTVTTMLFLKNISLLDRVKVQLDDTVYNLKLTHLSEENEFHEDMEVSIDNKNYDATDFRRLYQLAIAIYRYGTTDKMPSGTPAFSITLYPNDGSKVLDMSFYDTSGALYTAKTSEGEVFTVKASDITYFVSQFERFLNGEEVLMN